MNRELRRSLRNGRVPQRYSLWVPDARGFLYNVPSTGFRVVQDARSAPHFDRAHAVNIATTFREITGLRVAVRPVHLEDDRADHELCEPAVFLDRWLEYASPETASVDVVTGPTLQALEPSLLAPA